MGALLQLPSPARGVCGRDPVRGITGTVTVVAVATVLQGPLHYNRAPGEPFNRAPDAGELLQHGPPKLFSLLGLGARSASSPSRSLARRGRSRSACVVNGRLGHEGEAATHAPHGHAARVRGSIHGPHPCTTAVPTASNSAAPAITIDVEERTATTPFAPRRSQPRRRPIVWSRSRRRLRRRLVTPLCGQGPRPAQPAPVGRRLSPPVSHRSRDFHTSCNNAGHRCGG